MYCANCGNEISTGIEFCTSCGTKAPKLCKDCGSPISSHQRFCTKCGKAVNTGCPKCGTELAAGVRFCPNCGTDTAKFAQKRNSAFDGNASSPMNMMNGLNMNLILKTSIYVLMGISLLLIMIAPGELVNGFKFIQMIFETIDFMPENIIYVIWVVGFLAMGTVSVVKVVKNKFNFILSTIPSALTFVFFIVIAIATELELAGMMMTITILTAGAAAAAYFLQKKDQN